MERNLISDFKLLMDILKGLPLCIAICQFINIISQFLGYKLILLDYISNVSILPLLFIFISSIVFKFCFYHRISLYYVIISQSICLYDTYIGIPIDLTQLLIVHVELFTLLLMILFYFKWLRKKKNL